MRATPADAPARVSRDDEPLGVWRPRGHRRTRSPRIAGALALAALVAAVMGAAAIRPARAQDPSPAATVIGQRTETCKSGHTFTVDAVDADLEPLVQGRPADGGMAWLIVVADVTNTGAERGDLYMALKVRVDRGGDFPSRSPGSREEIDLAAEYEVQPSFQALDVGWNDRYVFTFQVPADATAFTLLGDPIHCD